MRLGKMCGLLMKAFLAVLMLFVTAAAVKYGPPRIPFEVGLSSILLIAPSVFPSNSPPPE